MLVPPVTLSYSAVVSDDLVVYKAGIIGTRLPLVYAAAARSVSASLPATFECRGINRDPEYLT